jgi:hypothetical protein
MELCCRFRVVAIFAACTLVILAGLAVAAAGQDNAAGQKWPPQFPREGATKLFENDRVIIWEQVGRPKTPFVHKHIRDIITIGLEPGKIATQTPDGKPTGGKLEGAATTRVRAGNPVGSVSYTTAGLGPHAEVMVDPANPGRSIFIELKGTEPKDCKEWSTGC